MDYWLKKNPFNLKLMIKNQSKTKVILQKNKLNWNLHKIINKKIRLKITKTLKLIIIQLKMIKNQIKRRIIWNI